MKKLNESEMEKLVLLNAYLLKATGTNFISKLENCALNDSCSELEAKDFLKKNYPGAQYPENLSKDDRELLSLLLRYYCQCNKQHEKFKKTHEAIKLATPERLPSLGFYDVADYHHLNKHRDKKIQEEIILAIPEPLLILSCHDSMVELCQ